MRKPNGFTFIEVLVVILMLVVVGGLIAVLAAGADNAKKADQQREMQLEIGARYYDVYRTTVKGHQYLVLRDSHNSNGGLALVHDVDCPNCR